MAPSAFGLQSIKLGVATMTPFGMEIVPAEDGGGARRPVFNIIWLVLWLAVGHLVSAVVLGITIIGLPFARQHLKLIPLALFSFGRELR